MKVSGRPLTTVLAAPFKRCHYVAAVNMLHVYKRPLEMFGRYLFGAGRYPAVVKANSPIGPLSLTVYSSHDVLTMNEIFCRRDYPASNRDKVFVDFGSNIGISAAYFLSRSPNGLAYLFEPLPQNTERMIHNLSRFEGRYILQRVAIGERDGNVEFGWEETGRYGGVGLKTGKYISVPCVDSNEVLRNILSMHGRIDVLKIDIETLERQVTERIPDEIARRIDRIYVEFPFAANPLHGTHTWRQYSRVAQFFSRTSGRGLH